MDVGAKEGGVPGNITRVGGAVGNVLEGYGVVDEEWSGTEEQGGG